MSEKTKEEQRLDMIEKLIENYENNCAGPYYTNRAQMRQIAKKVGAFKKKRYVLTDADKERQRLERNALDELKRTRRERSEASRIA